MGVWGEGRFACSGWRTQSAGRVKVCQERGGRALGDRGGRGRGCRTPARSHISQPVMSALATFLNFTVHIKHPPQAYRTKGWGCGCVRASKRARERGARSHHIGFLTKDDLTQSPQMFSKKKICFNKYNKGAKPVFYSRKKNNFHLIQTRL